MNGTDAWSEHRRALGDFIRSQRKLAKLSLRQLSALSNISNPYLSQVERGLHVPSVRVLHAIAEALDLSAETVLLQAGLVRATAGSDGPGDRAGAVGAGHSGRRSGSGTERAIRADSRLTDGQKEALIAVYQSYVSAPPTDPTDPAGPVRTDSGHA